MKPHVAMRARAFGAAVSAMGLLGIAPAAHASSAATVDSFNPGASSWVNCMAVQPDGKILVGGNFTNLGGQARNCIGRLNGDGTLDTSFDPGAGSEVFCLAVQPDGKILVGGTFTNLGGQARNSIGRLHADGTLDSAFNPYASSVVRSLAVQADGKILMGGSFYTLGGQACTNIARLHADGTVDTAFSPAALGEGHTVYSFALQADGKILVGGSFSWLAGQSRPNIGRLNADGTLDTAFDSRSIGLVYCLALQADGKILVGGTFSSLGGQFRNSIGRLHADGTVDGAFDPGSNYGIQCLAVQADGRILVGGGYTTLGGQARAKLGRLNADGSLDAAFEPEANDSVRCLALQADGRILVGGEFGTLGGQARNKLGRLNNTDPATQNLTFGGTTITWQRGGTGPEVWRTSFEGSTNGSDWISLGDGTRIPGGWQLTSVSALPDCNIRARGFVSGGSYDGSGWFVETVMTSPPVIHSQPVNQTKGAGATAIFDVSAVGTPPLGYRWYKDGDSVAGGGNISGATSPVLTLSNLLGGNAGGYSVVISNAIGSVTSLVATLEVMDPFITDQPTNQVASVGQTTMFTVTVAGTEPLSYQWRKDGAAVEGANTESLTLPSVQSSDRGSFDVVVSNAFGSITSATAVLTVYLASPDSFAPGTSGTVNSLAVQADGKVLVGGMFTNLGGQARSRIGRLHADGTLDMAFNPGASSNVTSLAVQADGKILVGGMFTSLGGQPRSHIGRLHADGTLDMAFNPGASSNVNSLAVQADGKILVGGMFTNLGGQARNRIGRLHADGTLDMAFNPNANGPVNSLAVQADGKVLVGGSFNVLGGQLRNRIGRLNADGTLDTAFDPNAGSTVNSLAVQGDGKVLVGGSFTTLGGQTRNRIGRLNADGTLDMAFDAGASSTVYSLAVQADGKILVGGTFTGLDGQACSRIGRLHADGTLDTTFSSAADGQVSSLGIQADGKVLVGGYFTTLGGLPRSFLGRLNNTDAASQNLIFGGTTITWLRGGSAPEVWRTAFEGSTNGSEWVSVGSGTRIPGGWQLTDITLTGYDAIRARGFVAGGYFNGSSWFVETVQDMQASGPPVIFRHPASQTNRAETTASFDVLAGGTLPLDYRWHREGGPLNDGINTSGAYASTLMLSNVLGDAAGGYFVIISNVFGVVTSSVATLSVEDPAVTIQPASQVASVGQTATFTAMVAGSTPFTCRWRKDGVVLDGATGTLLTVLDARWEDEGNYDVLVSNVFGSVTSEVAVLTVGASSPDSFAPVSSGIVLCTAEQVDGKVLVGGQFSTLEGQPRSRIGRLNADGTLDTAFAPSGADSMVRCLAVQSDGKILVGGSFTNLCGQPRNCIGRLNADGTLDSTFDPSANREVRSLVVQADGKILVGGIFTNLGGQVRNRIVRLNADGSLDAAFDPDANGAVYSIVAQSDGSILVAGAFTAMGGQTCTRIARIHADGTRDTSFNPNAGAEVFCLALQPDGRIVVGGLFGKLNGAVRHHIGRLNADGTLDSAFDPGASSNVNSIVLQTDGQILVGGVFTNLAGQACSRIGRLNPDGTLDVTFSSGTDGVVQSLGLQADGKVLVGGNFTTLGGVTRRYLGRLNNTDPASQNLTCEGTAITWLRGGSGPEVWRTAFDGSPNGGDWVSLGDGARIPGGWQLTNVTLTAYCAIRARGFVAGGLGDGSGWFVESARDLQIEGPAVIFRHPASQTNRAGATASFDVLAGGTLPLHYHWCKDGVLLNDGSAISGSLTSSLMLSNLRGDAAGGYSVIVSNALGVATSTVATLTVVDPVVTQQPVSQGASIGQTALFTVAVAGTEPLSYQWRKDGEPLAGETTSSLTLTKIQGDAEGGYDVLVSNVFGSVTSDVAVLTVYLASPDSFLPEVNGKVFSLAVQADGKTLVGGQFSTLGGQARSSVGRLNTDGTLDTAFNPPGADNSVNCFVVQVDGKVLVGGSFTNFGGQTRTRIGRLNADGTLDASFNPGANSNVSALAVQPDGKILVGGRFETLGGQARNRIGRLNADGTLDTAFDPNAGNNTVGCLVVQPDGKILVTGSFNTLGGQARNRIGRLNADGTLDTAFDPDADNYVVSAALQTDGKILVGGGFAKLGGQTRSRIGRLNADGTLDTAFNPGANGTVFSIAVQSDGKILVGGTFTTLAGQTCSRIGRLCADGTLDTTFSSATDGDVYALAVQADGKVMVGGSFATLGGLPRSFLGRLNNTDPATQNLIFEGTTITWLRGGTGPEVWRTSLEGSLDGSEWISLGAGTRIADGWQLASVTALPYCAIRARGFVAGGYYNGSGWFVETFQAIQIAGPPVIYRQPAGQTNRAGATIVFDVWASGTAPLEYRWRKGGSLLTDGGMVSGAQTTSLTLSNLLGDAAGGYSVIVSNAAGCVTSSVAHLSVVDPDIVTQPVSQATSLGQTALLAVAASGTTPFSYQWRKDGEPVTGETSAALTLTDAQWDDAGNYDVLVSNVFGVVTSEVAVLTVYLVAPDSFAPAADGRVSAMAVQADGKILVAGGFTNLGGQVHHGIARLGADGTVDAAFNPDADSAVNCLAVQADGKILVGGTFTGLCGQPRNRLGRLNANGTPDVAFNPNAGANVHCLAVQTDGRILVGGIFTTLGGQPRNRLGRLNADGALDATFNPNADGAVNSLAVQGDGRIVVGGSFTTLAGVPRQRLGRIYVNGTLDASFNPDAGSNVNCVAVQADGKILVGGSFTELGGQTRNRIGRLNADGSLDAAFDPDADGTVHSLAVQADGRILVGGSFTTLGGLTCHRIGRLNADGTVDATFSSGADGDIYALGVQADGMVLVGGDFALLGGLSRTCLGRLSNTGAASQSMAFDGTTITWLRGGPGPEVWRTSFEASTDGGSWTSLGAGTRIPGGWQRTPVSTLPYSDIRARGFVAGGCFNGSGWFTETVLAAPVTGPPVIYGQPASQTNGAGAAARFDVSVRGPLPLDCRWWKDGAVVIDGGNVSGAETPALTLSNLLGGAAGGYFAIVTNAFGSATSAVATLSVVDPAIVAQPTNRTANSGTEVVFAVVAAGTPPLGYQWRKDGGTLSGATAALLTLDDVEWADRGNYDVTVSNSFGSVTSQVALLTVISPPLIVTPPQGQVIWAGSNATFDVVAGGMEPLRYQWRFNEGALGGATNSNLDLTNVQSAQAGDYSVIIANAVGSVTSAPAELVVLSDASRIVRLIGTNALPGSTVSVPVSLDAQGNENALAFSVAFDPSLLVFAGGVLGSGAPGASFFSNTNQAGSGRVGMTFAMPAGTSLSRGAQEVVRLSFHVPDDAPYVSAVLAFTNLPIPRGVSDPQSVPLAATFLDGIVTISGGGGYEADVMPLPSGNGAVTITDWVKVGRYFAGLDAVPSASQFQKADCALRSTLGDGTIFVTDWVQAGRYAIGLDPLTAVGGPIGPAQAPAKSANKILRSAVTATGAGAVQSDSTARVIRIRSAIVQPGQTSAVPVQMIARGDENALGFSLTFDTNRIGFVSAALGSGAPGGTLNVNTNELASGSLGIGLGLPIGATFAAGTQDVVQVAFAVATHASGTTVVGFSDVPAFREVSDANANTLPADYQSGVLSIGSEPDAPLELLAPERPAPGLLRLSLAMADGSPSASQRVAGISLWATTNLSVHPTNWTRLATAPLWTNGLLSWDLLDFTNCPARFYRLMEP